MTDEEYEAVCAEIVRLENIDYASPEARALQEWLGDVVLQEYLDGLTIVDGEVVSRSELDE